MSFLNRCSTIIRRSSKDLFFINLDKGISYNYYDSTNDYIFSNTLLEDNEMNFSNCYFTLNKLDEIYGVYVNSSLNILTATNNSNTFIEKEVLNYDFNKFGISFPYINIVGDNIHIFYYVYNLNSNNTCALFHHVKQNNVWTENKIDFLNYFVLDNYKVVWIQNSPIVFYFKLVDGFEELFLCKFNISTLTWSNPIQVTNSKKNKLYLNILKDNMNFYHLVFCENTNGSYSIRYLNGYLNDSSFQINTDKYIVEPSANMYPSLMKKDSKLYLMWVDFGRLYTSFSDDLGKTWSDPKIDEFSLEENFIRANFYSNYKEDLSYNVNSVFTSENDIGIIGF